MDDSPVVRICDLVGDLEAAPRGRPSVVRALRQCRRGCVVAAQEAGEALAVAVLADDSAFVVPDCCPHDGGLLSDGFVDGDRLVCSRHGWEFELSTGRCLGQERFIPVRRLGKRAG